MLGKVKLHQCDMMLLKNSLFDGLATSLACLLEILQALINGFSEDRN